MSNVLFIKNITVHNLSQKPTVSRIIEIFLYKNVGVRRKRSYNSGCVLKEIVCVD